MARDLDRGGADRRHRLAAAHAQPANLVSPLGVVNGNGLLSRWPAFTLVTVRSLD
jgi:hypothetical protein